MIYLDYNASTPVDPAVLEAMLPYFTERFGNPSSSGHAYGWVASEAVDVAREQVATLIGAEPREILFTSGATESVNLALRGVAAAYTRKGRHLVTVQTEHKAVLDTCRALERDGFTTTFLPVGPDGRIDLDHLADAITDETILVAVMWANNETGTLQPMQAIADLVHARGTLLMTDATQAIGKIPVDVEGIDLLACSGHKVYGPKGVGALYVRRRNPRVRLTPLITGGGQERDLRAGTLNTPGIVGLGAAMKRAGDLHPQEGKRLAHLRDRFEDTLLDALPDVTVNGSRTHRLPNTTNLTFAGAKSRDLIPALRDLAFSTGSACSSASGKPSHVLKALGLSDEAAFSTVRISLGRFTTEDEIDTAVARFLETVLQLRTPSVSAPSL